MTYAPAPRDNIIWCNDRFRAAAETHSGRGDPFAGSYSRRLSRAPERVPWGFIVSACVVAFVVIAAAVRL